MKFGHEYETALANEGFPQEWVQSAIQYKHLKKVIKKVHNELEGLGLHADTLGQFSEWVEQPRRPSAVNGDANTPSNLPPVAEEFAPQLRILVDSVTGIPLNATLHQDTKEHLLKLAKHDRLVEGRKQELGLEETDEPVVGNDTNGERSDSMAPNSSNPTKWVTVPLSSANDFFNMLEPKLEELEALRDAETHALEEKILDLGDAVENVVEPVRDGFEAYRKVSYRDLYFWREMFRLYLENPIFYSDTERRRGALTFAEARARLEAYDKQLQSTGLLAKLKTPQAKAAARQFLDLNVHILRIMHFQEMNAHAMGKILKKFNKRTRTHLEGRSFLNALGEKYPALLPSTKSKTGGFADSIARDLQAEIGSKVLAIVPQLDDWICPVCYSMAWRPVNLGCCRSVFCIRCIIQLQDDGHKRCPMCNAETVLQADGRNLDFETMDFLEKYFPLEVKKRQKENERANLIREKGEHFVKPACAVM